MPHETMTTMEVLSYVKMMPRVKGAFNTFLKLNNDFILLPLIAMSISVM